MEISKFIYDNSPVFVQNIMASVKGYMIKRKRFDKNFHKELHRYENGYYNPEKLLRDILKSSEQTAFYRNQFADCNINIDAADVFNELKKIPILERETIITNQPDFINNNFNGKTFMVGTSGTTAKALVFPSYNLRENRQWAVWWRYRRRLGIELNTLCGHFGNKVIVPIKNKKPPYWRSNYFGKQIMFSPFHLSLDTIEDYHTEIKNKKLTWLHGHAHHISLLSSLIVEKKLSPIESVSFVTTGSDSLFVRHRNIIGQAFPNAIVRQHYGLTEAVANISEDIDGNLKIDEEHGYVEFIPLNEKNSSLYRIIGTGYHNHAFPLLRYDTGDLATIEKNNDGTYRIVQIDGRTSECLHLPRGKRISATALSNFEYTTYVRDVQFFQQDIYNIEMRLVIREGYSEDDEKLVLKLLLDRLPSDVNVTIKYVEELEKTKSGKVKYIISEVE